LKKLMKSCITDASVLSVEI
jgi:hypothetical protein